METQSISEEKNISLEKVSVGHNLFYITPICPVSNGEILYCEIYKNQQGIITHKPDNKSVIIYEKDGMGQLIANFKGVPILIGEHITITPENKDLILKKYKVGSVNRVIDPRKDGINYFLQNGKAINLQGYIWVEFSIDADKIELANDFLETPTAYFTSTSFREIFFLQEVDVTVDNQTFKIAKCRVNDESGANTDHILLTTNPYFDWAYIVDNNKILPTQTPIMNSNNITRKDLTNTKNNNQIQNNNNCSKNMSDQNNEDAVDILKKEYNKADSLINKTIAFFGKHPSNTQNAKQNADEGTVEKDKDDEKKYRDELDAFRKHIESLIMDNNKKQNEEFEKKFNSMKKNSGKKNESGEYEEDEEEGGKTNEDTTDEDQKKKEEDAKKNTKSSTNTSNSTKHSRDFYGKDKNAIDEDDTTGIKFF